MTNPAPGNWRLAVYGARSSRGGYHDTPRAADQRRVLEMQGDNCLYCQIPIGTIVWRRYKATRRSLTVTLRRNWDHFVPYAFLEQNPGMNWVLACHVCNRIKKASIFATVEDAREAILSERERLGYEAISQVLARISVD